MLVATRKITPVPPTTAAAMSSPRPLGGAGGGGTGGGVNTGAGGGVTAGSGSDHEGLIASVGSVSDAAGSPTGAGGGVPASPGGPGVGGGAEGGASAGGVARGGSAVGGAGGDAGGGAEGGGAEGGGALVGGARVGADEGGGAEGGGAAVGGEAEGGATVIGGDAGGAAVGAAGAASTTNASHEAARTAELSMGTPIHTALRRRIDHPPWDECGSHGRQRLRRALGRSDGALRWLARERYGTIASRLMRIQILEIGIEGFRAIREPLMVTLEHPRGGALGRVVLAGSNGSGKTSVLEAILLALGREDLVVRDLPAANRGDHWRVEVPPGGKIHLRCRILDQPSLFGSEVSITRTADRWESRYEPSGHEISAEEIRAWFGGASIEYFSSWRAPMLPGGVQPALRGGRPPDDNEANRLWRLKLRIVNERTRRAFARDGQEPSQARDESWLRRINEVWASFHADGSTIDADIVDPRAEDPYYDLFVFDGSTRRCSIDQISSGELELVTMAGTLLLSDFDGLLLVDEPELHLHREWQTQLMDAFAAMAPGAQVIVATHADAPWDQVYSFERFFLARPGDPRGGNRRLRAVPTEQ